METKFQQLFDIDLIQVSRYWTMKELYEKIRKLLEIQYKLAGYNIRIWQNNHHFSKYDTVQYLTDHIRNSDYRIFGKIIDENLDEKLEFCDIINRNDILIVEISEGSEFLFQKGEYAYNADKEQGRCA